MIGCHLYSTSSCEISHHLTSPSTMTNNASQSGTPMDESGFVSSHDCTVPRVEFGGGGDHGEGFFLGSAHNGLAIGTTLAFNKLPFKFK